MRETALILPTLNCQDRIEQSLEAALLQTVNPYRIIVADGGSTDRTVDIARRIGARATSAGLIWFSFDLIQGRDQKDALDLTFAKIRSDCVILVDVDRQLDRSWSGAASVALYSIPEGRSVHTRGAIAFNHTQWRRMKPKGPYEGVQEVISRASKSKELVLGAITGSYVLQ